MANAPQRLAAAGLSTQLATEIARQFAAGAGNGKIHLLTPLGVPQMSAKALVDGINAGSVNADKLCAAMWNPHTARVLASVYANP